MKKNDLFPEHGSPCRELREPERPIDAPHGLECRTERIQKAFTASGAEPAGMREGQRRPEFGA